MIPPGDAAGRAVPVRDHIGLWRDELCAWTPARFFDAHVHLGPARVMGPLRAARRREPLCTCSSLEWEQVLEVHARLFEGKEIVGMFAFPFPLREVDIDAANDAIVDAMRRDRRVHGLFLAHPTDARRSIAACERARARGAPFRGAKPYFDLLGKSNFQSTMPEFIPEALLEFLDDQGMILMLHTSGTGVGDAANRRYLCRIAGRYPRVRVILAHMGRYIRPEQFFRFIGSGLLEDHPNLFLDLSSASVPEVYERLLAREALWPRLLFASDIPYGLIAGVERWSATRGAIFLTRDRHPWTDPAMAARHAAERRRLTHNTYHCIQALKDAFDRLGLRGRAARPLQRAIFARNAIDGVLRARDSKGGPT